MDQKKNIVHFSTEFVALMKMSNIKSIKKLSMFIMKYLCTVKFFSVML